MAGDVELTPAVEIARLRARLKELEERLATAEALNAQARGILIRIIEWWDVPENRTANWSDMRMLRNDAADLLSTTPKLLDLEAADELVEKWLEISPNITHVPGGLAPQMDALTQRWLASRGQIPEKEGQDGAYKP